MEGLIIASLLVIGLPVAVGAYAAARQTAVASLRERAERAEAEEALRGESARLAEHARIAREMHDVIGHRISLVTLHAGALEELREVLEVLRAGDPCAADAATPPAPQPTLGDVAGLVLDSSRAGVDAVLHHEIVPDLAPTPLVGSTAYRVVQESLANAARHAPGAAAHVRLTGRPGAGLGVEVSTTRAVGAVRRPASIGAGFGLVGLRERVELAGGRLETGAAPGGGFVVRACLPWPLDHADVGGQPDEHERPVTPGWASSR